MTLNENDIDSLIEYLQSTWKDLSESADPLAIIKESSLPFLNENMFHMFEKYFEKPVHYYMWQWHHKYEQIISTLYCYTDNICIDLVH